jgi:hypothetical protein
VAQVGTGTLGPGQSDRFSTVLQAGISYDIYVQPADTTTDFDLRVYDENSNLVCEDIDTTANALCRVRPKWTGPFTIVVTCHRGYSRYGVIVG